MWDGVACKCKVQGVGVWERMDLCDAGCCHMPCFAPIAVLLDLLHTISYASH